MKDIGEGKEVLWFEINRNQNTKPLFLSREKYTQKVVGRFGMSNSLPVATSHQSYTIHESKLFFGSNEEAADVPYRQAIESIMYPIIGTWPDLAF